MSKISKKMPSCVEKAAARMAGVINCKSILEYAMTLRDPHEVDFIAHLITKMGLHAPCSKNDMRHCVDYLDNMAEWMSRPQFIKEQHNHGCQQFYGAVSMAYETNDDRNRKNRFAA